MKITVLMENTTSREDLIKEHGLSLYIETANHKLLFDTGQTNGFITNVKTMGIDLSQVDKVFISHGHYDHGGGIQGFLEINHHAKIYISREAFQEFYSQKADGRIVSIGLDNTLQGHEQIVLLDGECHIDDNLEVLSGGGNCYPKPTMNNKLFVKVAKDGSEVLVADDFNHEQHLVIKENDFHLLISGCAHNGILNILDAYHIKYGNYPNVVFSGFHLSNDTTGFMESEENLNQIIETFKSMDSQFYTGHCTGTKAFNYLHKDLTEKVLPMRTGNTFEWVNK